VNAKRPTIRTIAEHVDLQSCPGHHGVPHSPPVRSGYQCDNLPRPTFLSATGTTGSRVGAGFQASRCSTDPPNLPALRPNPVNCPAQPARLTHHPISSRYYSQPVPAAASGRVHPDACTRT
jgi:hypothetical protein